MAGSLQLARRLPALIAALAVVLAPSAALGQDAPADLLPVEELLADAEGHNNTTITVEGELVGDYGFRNDGYMWTQLNDDSYARDAIVDGGPRTGGNTGIGVRMPTILADGLDPAGGYRLEGPLVQLTGTWKYHDPDRGGESYLDVVTLVVVEPGRRIEEGPDWIVFALGALLIAATLVLWRQRKKSEAEAE